MPALYGLMFIVVSGAAGRLLDIWQARVIARDASANRVGIAKAIPGRLLELEYIIERLNAGKSEPFKHYCIQAMSSVGKLPMPIPTIEPREQADFEQAFAALEDHARLVQKTKQSTIDIPRVATCAYDARAALAADCHLSRGIRTDRQRAAPGQTLTPWPDREKAGVRVAAVCHVREDSAGCFSTRTRTGAWTW